MSKKIITIAEIVFALIFVVILALFMSTITNKGNSANTKLVDTLEMTDNTSLNSYDGSEMKGEAVINAIKNVKSIGGDLKLKVVVKTKMNTSGAEYGFTATSATEPVAYDGTAASKDSGHNDYINPSALFSSELVKNSNNVVTGITFTQQ